jgi:pimeloyl-ACP methyl ester carboxylesterase
MRVVDRRPFRRLPFDEVPELPRLPHGLARCRTDEITLDSRGFGRIRVHVRTIGGGPPLLLVHGLMTSSYSFRYVYGALATRFTVYAPDLPSAGRTEARPEHAHTPDALATFVGDIQRALDIEGCLALGNSLGGYVCLRRAFADPRAFSRLVVVHAPAFASARFYALHAALAVPGSRSLLSWMIRRDPVRWAFRNVHYYDETLKSLEEAREYAHPLRTDEGARAFGRWLSDALDPRSLRAFEKELEHRRARSDALPMPVQLVYARTDPMVPPSVGPRLAALLPGAELVWLEDTSHFAHVDTPQQVLDAVLPFLGG